MSHRAAFKDIYTRVLARQPITPIEKTWLVNLSKETDLPPHIIAIVRKIENNEL